MKNKIFKIDTESIDQIDILIKKCKIRKHLKDYDFYIKFNKQKEDSFYIAFKKFLDKNYNYSNIESLETSKQEPKNEKIDGDLRIGYDGYINNFVYCMWLDNKPLKIKLSGYFILKNENHVFYPSTMSWDDSLLV